MSPEAWSDMRPRIAAVAAAWNLLVEWPNERLADQLQASTKWVSIDLGSDVAERIELGRDVWSEDGSLWIHVMVPIDSGIDRALQIRKAFSVAFRGVQPGVNGLWYRSQAFDPLGPDDGVYRRLTLLVRYEFTDILS